LVPCPRIVEPWTPPATAPGRRQPALAASSGRGRRGDPTPRAASQPRPATSTTENTTRRPFPPTKQPSPAKSPNAVDEGAQGHSRQPRTALEAAKPQVSTVMRNQHHRERGHGPRPRGGTLRPGRACLEALHSAQNDALGHSFTRFASRMSEAPDLIASGTRRRSARWQGTTFTERRTAPGDFSARQALNVTR
jgi:hypothetical protein